jgi:hypothetical protein
VKLLLIISALALGSVSSVSSASPAAAQVSIRQYQQQGAPTPYPNALGDSDVGPVQPPQSEFMTPEQVPPAAAPALPSAPSLYLS